MFISKLELDAIQSDIKELQKSTYELHILIHSAARAVGLKWIPPQQGKFEFASKEKKE